MTNNFSEYFSFWNVDYVKSNNEELYAGLMRIIDNNKV